MDLPLPPRIHCILPVQLHTTQLLYLPSSSSFTYSHTPYPPIHQLSSPTFNNLHTCTHYTFPLQHHKYLLCNLPPPTYYHFKYLILFNFLFYTLLMCMSCMYICTYTFFLCKQNIVNIYFVICKILLPQPILYTTFTNFSHPQLTTILITRYYLIFYFILY